MRRHRHSKARTSSPPADDAQGSDRSSPSGSASPSVSPSLSGSNSSNRRLSVEDQGYPTVEEFEQQVQEYHDRLHKNKKTKAMCNNALYAKIVYILNNPTDTSFGDAQARFWARTSSYELDASGTRLIDKDAGKPVCPREDFYDVITAAHRQVEHGGRDKTHVVVKANWSWLPKEIVARYVSVCPTCIAKNKHNKVRSGPFPVADAGPSAPKVVPSRARSSRQRKSKAFVDDSSGDESQLGLDDEEYTPPGTAVSKKTAARKRSLEAAPAPADLALPEPPAECYADCSAPTSISPKALEFTAIAALPPPGHLPPPFYPPPRAVYHPLPTTSHPTYTPPEVPPTTYAEPSALFALDFPLAPSYSTSHYYPAGTSRDFTPPVELGSYLDEPLTLSRSAFVAHDYHPASPGYDGPAADHGAAQRQALWEELELQRASHEHEVEQTSSDHPHGEEDEGASGSGSDSSGRMAERAAGALARLAGLGATPVSAAVEHKPGTKSPTARTASERDGVLEEDDDDDGAVVRKKRRTPPLPSVVG
ncbi:hypothetical protein JCM10207_005783 [Rhodosporidiobolus poonsookiae]